VSRGVKGDAGAGQVAVGNGRRNDDLVARGGEAVDDHLLVHGNVGFEIRARLDVNGIACAAGDGS
jgi:hypothetical protein